MRRREFITLLGGAVAVWPFAARAQQAAMPVIGLLSTRTPTQDPQLLAAFRQGLNEAGYVEGRNVAIDYRFAENQYDRLPAMAAELARRQVAVIAAPGNVSALAAKGANSNIPIVFLSGGDPVKIGLVASLSRPGGNATGMTQMNAELAPKRLELLHELVPAAGIIGVLLNPANPNSEPVSTDLHAAALNLGVQLHVMRVGAESDFDGAFASFRQAGAGALLFVSDPFLISRIPRLAALTVRHAMPAVFQFREFAAAGGLISYGASNIDSWRLVGVYVGRVLKGEKPADLPVQQVTKVELIINLNTAKARGLTVPTSLLGRADEVIE